MDKKRFGNYSLLLIPAGILLNLCLSKLILLLKIPLFLDSVGTIITAALGGYLPGIVVGFFSNVINGISDPITLYYGIISVLIAICASYLARRGVFYSIKKTLLSVLAFSAIGGGLGSVLTWLLYGFNFGTGISAPFAVLLHESIGMSKFSAQFLADMVIDIADKTLTVLAAYFAFRFIPERYIALFRQNVFSRSKSENNTASSPRKLRRRLSLRTEVVMLIIATSVILGSIAITISFAVYKQTTMDKFIDTANGVTDMMENIIDEDKINWYLGSEVEDETYINTERRLMELKNSFPDIMYMYVYQVKADGCHVVFDLDTDELTGEPLGAVVQNDDAFGDYLDDLLAGREIDPIISNETYGWLLTVYHPLINSHGSCVAYAATDISMEDVIADRYVYVIKMAALLFGAAIIIVGYALYLADKQMVEPINAMTAAARKFAEDSADERLDAVESLRGLKVRSSDEIGMLYEALVKTAADMAQYINDVRGKAQIISNMQNSVILAFANMVENRDCNTGEHIKHTAEYVRIIARGMQENGVYQDILTDKYVENIVQSAPLHDIGKIKIPDAILKATPHRKLLQK